MSIFLDQLPGPLFQIKMTKTPPLGLIQIWDSLGDSLFDWEALGLVSVSIYTKDSALLSLSLNEIYQGFNRRIPEQKNPFALINLWHKNDRFPTSEPLVLPKRKISYAHFDIQNLLIEDIQNFLNSLGN